MWHQDVKRNHLDAAIPGDTEKFDKKRKLTTDPCVSE
jgi:hypothetical protein